MKTFSFCKELTSELVLVLQVCYDNWKNHRWSWGELICVDFSETRSACLCKFCVLSKFLHNKLPLSTCRKPGLTFIADQFLREEKSLWSGCRIQTYQKFSVTSSGNSQKHNLLAFVGFHQLFELICPWLWPACRKYHLWNLFNWEMESDSVWVYFLVFISLSVFFAGDHMRMC